MKKEKLFTKLSRRSFVCDAYILQQQCKADWQFVSTLATKNTKTESGKVATES
ncbi:hypothetical protein [Parachryseolinea silvisoli]|uniref:hypothetical protein n=1 Tax=Parachryseolinea silvisoli TaxID=2873601 RepID=UPI002265EEAA|nr:hypothetical protein [Parachryseolinea silvisoli]MCD9016542.1 hypothetical protein [Parachryseolinea silvisoli]